MVMPFKVPPAWSLVLVGLVLNILAIVMSSVVLDRLSAQIATLAEQKDENIYSIQLAGAVSKPWSVSAKLFCCT